MAKEEHLIVEYMFSPEMIDGKMEVSHEDGVLRVTVYPRFTSPQGSAITGFYSVRTSGGELVQRLVDRLMGRTATRRVDDRSRSAVPRFFSTLKKRAENTRPV